jgi:nicotinamide-nucleotide amidase
MFPADLVASAEALLATCRTKGLRVVTAESCTGGLIAGVLTEVPGSSDVVERGFVTYSNAAKVEVLGVAPAVIDRHGAVSAAVAVAMAEGALNHAHADVAVAATGIAGPGGGTAQKPVGLVYLAVHRRGAPAAAHRFNFPATSRHDIRLASVREALRLLSEAAAT